MRIRIIKTPPAPLMDGFDVGHLEAGQIHDVEGDRANYLLLAGYAVRDGLMSPYDVSRVIPLGGEPNASRRAEDIVREELRDARARIIGPELDGEHR